MKKWGLLSAAFALLVIAVLYLAAEPHPSPVAHPPADPPAPPTVHRLPYDSIRTDLSAYMWPTDAGRVITSTFGEFRRSHFHGGIDISTGDRTGYRVFASRDGYVSRIRVNANGYGKMLYIRHVDGYTTTYAHLRNFAPALDTRVEQEEERLERYPVDITCTPTEFPVKRGDLVAYTGDTGTGSAHLHFEIRDENMNMVNPFLCSQFTSPDHFPPVIRRVALVPIGELARVSGSWHPRIFKAHTRTATKSYIAETLRGMGKVGLAIDARDKADGTWFRRGVYRYELQLDDHPLYRVRLDRVPAQDAHEIGLYYNWDMLSDGRGRFEKLYMDTPNDLPFYAPAQVPSGVIDLDALPAGRHTFRIVCADIAGNTSEVSGTIEAEPRFQIAAQPPPTEEDFSDVQLASASRGSGIRTGGMSMRLEYHPEFIRAVVTSSGSFSRQPSLVVYEGSVRRTFTMELLSHHEAAGTFRPIDTLAGIRRIVAVGEVGGREQMAREECTLYPIPAGKTGSISIDGGALVVGYDSLSVFQTVFLRVEKFHDDDVDAYALLPERTILREGLTVSLASTNTDPHASMYFRGPGSWEMMMRRTAGGYYTGRIGRMLGDLAVMTDRTAPHIGTPRITSLRGGTTRVLFSMGDGISGVEFESLKMYIDGTLAIPEIDGEHRRAEYHSHGPLTRGSHHLTIRLSDRAGNTSTEERNFLVR